MFTLVVVSVAGGEPIKGDTATCEVTVYANRARVMHRARLDLKTGPATYRFGVPLGWTVEGSARVPVSPTRLPTRTAPMCGVDVAAAQS